MGDVAMTIPILRAFVNKYPEVKLTVLTREFFTPFFRDLKKINIHFIDVKGKHKGIKGLYKLSKELKTLNIDAIADLHNVLRSKILKIFLPEKNFAQINKGRSEKKLLISGKQFHQLKTTHQRYADVFEELGFSLNLTNQQFLKPQSLSDKIIDLVGREYLNWVGIAPFAAHKAKMYPLDLMEQVIAELSKTYKVILFGGGKHEIKFLNILEGKYKNTISIAGKLNLDEELDVISNLSIMLSMDSGNAHIAAMLGVKVITIWGVTHPYAGFAPYNQPRDYALVSDRKQFPKIPTSIYGNKYPKTYLEASRSIAPEIVIQKIKSVISEEIEI
ncbi:glycosyltransferase family 9 protein [Flavobacteriaceae bacterium AU392]|nr:glycosyltransferase family 9 protein [Flavobacteriaceae bacterium]RKM85157.1 glycosyltransferase family 9 protein [Flavobacteriaceae bacterium AU392]